MFFGRSGVGLQGIAETGEGHRLYLRVLQGQTVGHFAAQTVPHEAHGPGIDKGEGPQEVQRGPPAVGGVEIRPAGIAGETGIAPADGVDGQDRETSAGQFQAIGIAGLPVVLVAVYIDDPRGPVASVYLPVAKQFGPHRDPVKVRKGDVADHDPSEILLHQVAQNEGADLDSQAKNQETKGPAPVDAKR